MNTQTVLAYLEGITAAVAIVPSPATPFAALALELEKIVGSSIAALAASKGQTVEQVITQLHQIQPVP